MNHVDRYGKKVLPLNLFGFQKYHCSKMNGVKKMPSIKDSAKAYESKKTKNIVELDSVSVDEDILVNVANEGTKDEFTYNYIVVDDEEYRVPNSVLEQLKEQIEENPKLKTFKVTKKGEGLNTKYTVIPK